MVRGQFQPARCAFILAVASLRFVPPSIAAEIPSGQTLEIRLRQTVSSYRAKDNQEVRAVLIAPVETEEGVALPAGAEVRGRIVRVRRVGLGLVRERARLRFSFDRILLSDGSELAVETKLVRVENAREKVQPDGEVRGIRSKESISDRASGTLLTLSTFDPLLMIFTFSSTTCILRFPDSEIYYPTGTELELELTRPLPVKTTYQPGVPALTTSVEENRELTEFVAKLPFRTRTLKGNVRSDITNLLFLGSEDQITRAFAAAGWSSAESLSRATEYETILAIAQNRGYAEAPMSVLTLDERVPELNYQKSLNTFTKRHHLRIWDLSQSWRGQPLWTAAATHDVGVTFSKARKHFIHLINPEIDQERAKVVNDLVFTKCVDGVEFVDRPHLPRDAKNSTGDLLLSDGRMAVIRFNTCEHPRSASDSLDTQPGRDRGTRLARGSRQLSLTLREEILRNNLGMQAYHGLRFLKKTAGARKASQLGPNTHRGAGLVYIDSPDETLAKPED